MKAYTNEQLKTLPVGTVVKFVWEDGPTAEDKSTGLMFIKSKTSTPNHNITLWDYPEEENYDDEYAMIIPIDEYLISGTNDLFDWPDSGIEFRLYPIN